MTDVEICVAPRAQTEWTGNVSVIALPRMREGVWVPAFAGMTEVGEGLVAASQRSRKSEGLGPRLRGDDEDGEL